MSSILASLGRVDEVLKFLHHLEVGGRIRRFGSTPLTGDGPVLMTLLAGSMSLSPGSAWTTTLVDSRMGQP
jgi:hypothetical protein